MALENIKPATARQSQSENASGRPYDWLSIFYHWTIALLFIGQISVGYVMSGTDVDPALQFTLFQWHKSVGFTVLVLAVFRLGWSLVRPNPKPHGGATLENLAARSVHVLLMLLTVAIPLAGWAVASTSPLQIPSYIFNLIVIPGLPMTISDQAEAFWKTVHATLSYTAASLVLLHLFAALWHHFVRKDATLQRMLPRIRHGSL
ncbi:cytochrome b [Rhizobium paknamense]|uniref:Cytochrome b561 n=1 Tax=Rhizobium paknamense TaxID=1206817 RepID=A0ABU0IDJ4_9HYPH|nr:cytochrome b [Rhizobium paknamense]MDQ0456318.1 cytochrome b561 [Rhizobium paknamense]